MATVKLLPVMSLAQGCWSPNLCSLLISLLNPRRYSSIIYLKNSQMPN